MTDCKKCIHLFVCAMNICVHCKYGDDWHCTRCCNADEPKYFKCEAFIPFESEVEE